LRYSFLTASLASATHSGGHSGNARQAENRAIDAGMTDEAMAIMKKLVTEVAYRFRGSGRSHDGWQVFADPEVERFEYTLSRIQGQQGKDNRMRTK
jgi:hypothetical protein